MLNVKGCESVSGEIFGHKVETPYHDNDLLLTPVNHHKVVDNELVVAQNFTRAVSGMEDGSF
jgi:hypothetical protein